MSLVIKVKISDYLSGICLNDLLKILFVRNGLNK
jgi:hypothetical protein